MKKSIINNQRGAVAIEYGLIAALMLVVLITALQGMNNNTNGMYATIDNKVGTAMTGAR